PTRAASATTPPCAPWPPTCPTRTSRTSPRTTAPPPSPPRRPRPPPRRNEDRHETPDDPRHAPPRRRRAGLRRGRCRGGQEEIRAVQGLPRRERPVGNRRFPDPRRPAQGLHRPRPRPLQERQAQEPDHAGPGREPVPARHRGSRGVLLEPEGPRRQVL